jgi:hypothetical protein
MRYDMHMTNQMMTALPNDDLTDAIMNALIAIDRIDIDNAMIDIHLLLDDDYPDCDITAAQFIALRRILAIHNYQSFMINDNRFIRNAFRSIFDSIDCNAIRFI